MLVVVNWIFAVPASIFGTVCLMLSVVLCICGCRTKESKNELVGIEGRVKITNPDEFVHEVNANNIPSEILSEKVQNTAKRSLPDLPVDTANGSRGEVTWEPNGDATSELYATVVLQDEKNKKHSRQKSDTDSINPSAYAKGNSDHAYDKLKKVEHPYAQVKNHDNDKRASSTSQLTDIIKEERASVQQFDADMLSSIRPGNESSGNIPAATAISGNVTANDDLPYMTPPAHFSGDSQDSGKGYTSISVREPLSAILADRSTTRTRRSDPHYATVSDDSDDMYAAIDDPSQIYTSESETYARIHGGSNRVKVAPQPPSVDSLKQMTISSQSHSRQASSSSLASSTAVSSPKPEKRPANSPLPPTPTKSPDTFDDIYPNIAKNIRRPGSPRNVEDMYAKVNKKGRREMDHLERGGSIESGVSESSDSLSFKLQTSTTESSRSCHSYLSKSAMTDTLSSSNGQIASESFTTETDPQSGYEKLGSNSFDPGYEMVSKGHSSESDPEYEKLKPQKYEYGAVERTHAQNYLNMDTLKSDTSDGYSRIKGPAQDSDACESDGYARVEPHEGLNSDYGYAKVIKNNNNNNKNSGDDKSNNNNGGKSKGDEKKHSDHEGGEPTYESLGNEFEESNDPNYESVNFVQKAPVEPPYQLLKDCKSNAADN